MSTEMTAGVVVTGSGSAVDRAADVLARHDVSHPDLHSGLGVAIICQCGARVAQTEDASWPVAHRAHVAEALRLAGLLADSGAETLRALSDAATPGPWEAGRGWAPISSPEEEVVAKGYVRPFDAAFIATAVNHVRAALAETDGTR